jgi:hypothetical protein
MNQKRIDTVVNAALYEGHILYPYRASAKKARQQFAFGRVYPESYSLAENGAEPCSMQIECLVTGGDMAALEILVRFLHPMERDIGALAAPLRQMPSPNNPDFFHVVPELEVDGRLYLGWQEMVERSVRLPAIALKALREKTRALPFSFPAYRALEPILDRSGHIAGIVVRQQDAIEGAVELEGRGVDESVTKVTVRVFNRTPVPSDVLDDREEIVMRTFASTHAVLHAREASFFSLIDPPEKYFNIAAGCRNLGAWPVLVGDAEKDERDTMIASPVILHDYPEIAAEDEKQDAEKIAPLILTVSGEAGREMHRGAGRTLRTTVPDLANPRHTKRSRGPRVDTVSIQGIVHKTGDLVRVRPRNRADAMALALAGRIAMIESIEQDAGEKTHLALVLEEEPNHGHARTRQENRRLVYTTDEVEPLEGE